MNNFELTYPSKKYIQSLLEENKKIPKLLFELKKVIINDNLDSFISIIKNNNIDLKFDNSYTLVFAMKSNAIKISKYIINNNLVDFSDRMNKPIRLAAKFSHFDLLKLLYKKNPKSINSNRQATLLSAVKNRNFEIFEFILNLPEIDVNYREGQILFDIFSEFKITFNDFFKNNNAFFIKNPYIKSILKHKNFDYAIRNNGLIKNAWWCENFSFVSFFIKSERVQMLLKRNDEKDFEQIKKDLHQHLFINF